MKRYVRNIALDVIDIEGQKKLNETTALVVGCGGLGSHLLFHLASFGFKKIILIDNDTVSISNLQRQILFKESSIGKKKVNEAEKALKSYNSEIEIISYSNRLKSLTDIKESYDIIFDCSDNLSTRLLLSKENNKLIPIVFASAVELHGWVYKQDKESKVKIEHILRETDDDKSCDDKGVLSPTVSFVASIQAMEGIKEILNLNNENNCFIEVDPYNYKITQMEF